MTRKTISSNLFFPQIFHLQIESEISTRLKKIYKQFGKEVANEIANAVMEKYEIRLSVRNELTSNKFRLQCELIDKRT